jgi:hypothetical protein
LNKVTSTNGNIGALTLVKSVTTQRGQRERITIILIWGLKRYDGVVLTGLIWLRIQTSGGLS